MTSSFVGDGSDDGDANDDDDKETGKEMRATCCEVEVHQAALFATWGRDLGFLSFFFISIFAMWGGDFVFFFFFFQYGEEIQMNCRQLCIDDEQEDN